MQYPDSMERPREEAVTGSLLGTAVGDALGLPYEGLPPRRVARFLPQPLRHRLVGHFGFCSDDTEHSCLVLLALNESGGDPERFSVALARRLRRWICALPAGTGLATARACLKLCVGISPERSGVASAGNGPAMRAAVLGAAIDDRSQLSRLVAASSRLTHSDPRAMQGALAVALAAWLSRQQADPQLEAFTELLKQHLPWGSEDPFPRVMQQLAESFARQESTAAFAHQLCGPRGVTGFVMQTVPVALHAWISFPNDYPTAIETIISCGGDTDTTAAIVGGIVGSRTGEAGIPREWLTNLREWPGSVRWMKQLASHTATGISAPLDLPWLAVFPRNLVFLAVVLLHGFRRYLPPY